MCEAATVCLEKCYNEFGNGWVELYGGDLVKV